MLSSLPSLYLGARNTRSINDSWMFRMGDSRTGNEGWKIVSIPHTWNATDAMDDEPGFKRGVAWYKKFIQLSDNQVNNPLYIFFEGANQETTLYVNGQKAGNHKGGYTFFCFDISSLVKEGKNLLEVKVDNSYNANIPPLTADFTFFGGIYRDVSLISSPAIHISPVHYASSGVYITTPEVSETSATVHVKTMLNNATDKNQKVLVEHQIYATSGEMVASHKKKIKLTAEALNFEHVDQLHVTEPELWCHENPALYRLRTTVYSAKGEKLEEVSSTFGIRSFSFSADNGFKLNGKSVKLIGTNRHQCYEGLGYALRDEMHIRDLRLLRDMGGNFLRVSHYPQDAMVLSACDRMGIVTSVEIPVINAVTMTQEFANCCTEMMKEMVHQNFNSPSVCIWAYMNEILLRPPYKTDKSISKDEYFKFLAGVVADIEHDTRTADPYRYTMIPCHGGVDIYAEAGALQQTSILGVNLYNGWYSGTFSGFEKSLEKLHDKYPDKPIIVTEYGADNDSRVHSYQSERFDYTTDYAVRYHRHYLPEILKRDYITGSAAWNLNDFHSEGRMDAIPHINCKGLVSRTRVPKDTYYYYQAMLLDRPFMAISGKNWKHRSGIGEGSCTFPMLVFSNCEDVELFVNGKSIGKSHVENGAASFNVALVNGRNYLEARGLKNGIEAHDALELDMNLVPSNPKDGSFRELNMMMGTNRYFEDDTAAMVWIPEVEYKEGGYGFIGGEAFRAPTNRGSQPASNLDIWGTDQDPLFQTQRRGIEKFKADVPNGEYALYLYWTELTGSDFAELAYQLGNSAKKENAVERSFHVEVNGVRVASDLNVAEEVGVRRPMICKIPVSVYDNEGITVNLIPVREKTMLTAVRLIKLN